MCRFVAPHGIESTLERTKARTDYLKALMEENKRVFPVLFLPHVLKNLKLYSSIFCECGFFLFLKYTNLDLSCS
jgi:hypothetical protein